LKDDRAERKSIYLIGDTHFDHANIIKYCRRPFANVETMNKFLVRSWNATVKDRDLVYFLGDWSYGRRSRSAGYWVRHLNGHIISINGSHDRGAKGTKLRVLHYEGYSFLLIHDPSEKPEDWYGWVIHGHEHNNNLKGYPFINGENKTINVSVELIDYKPLNIDFLLALQIDSIRRMQTSRDAPERWKASF
jgi:calcineurin-like phosphoesterase family protein